jgi:hypothetical protein
MTISWTRNPNGTGSTTVVPDAPKPAAVPTRYEVVDRTDRQAMAAWRAGDPDTVGFTGDPDCRCIRDCACGSYSTDPLD